MSLPDDGPTTRWDVSFLHTPQPANTANDTDADADMRPRRALIILNQPFSRALLQRAWDACSWRACADGGANRLYDALGSPPIAVDADTDTEISLGRNDFIPDLIKGDLDSIRPDVQAFYEGLGVPTDKDPDQYATDLMKCVAAVRALEESTPSEPEYLTTPAPQYTIVILGGLSGRLDQTVHTLSYLHKLRLSRKRVFALTDDTLGWVLPAGAHAIHIDRTAWGPTCGLLPVGVQSTTLTTRGLEWDLTERESSFDGLVSTSNHIASDEVYISTTQPIWWCMEVKGHSHS